MTWQYRLFRTMKMLSKVAFWVSILWGIKCAYSSKSIWWLVVGFLVGIAAYISIGFLYWLGIEIAIKLLVHHPKSEKMEKDEN